MPDGTKPNQPLLLNSQFTRALAIIVVLTIIILIWLIHDKNKPFVLKSSIYTSSQYGFTIEFPGSPRTSHISKTYENIKVDTTNISSSVDNNTQHFGIYASNVSQITKYLALSNTGKLGALSRGADSSISVLLNATDINNTATTFLGYPAIEVSYETSHFEHNQTGYARVFVIGNTEYVILETGSAKSNFENFANSFKYNGK